MGTVDEKSFLSAIQDQKWKAISNYLKATRASAINIGQWIGMWSGNLWHGTQPSTDFQIQSNTNPARLRDYYCNQISKGWRRSGPKKQEHFLQILHFSFDISKSRPRWILNTWELQQDLSPKEPGWAQHHAAEHQHWRTQAIRKKKHQARSSRSRSWLNCAPGSTHCSYLVDPREAVTQRALIFAKYMINEGKLQWKRNTALLLNIQGSVFSPRRDH